MSDFIDERILIPYKNTNLQLQNHEGKSSPYKSQSNFNKEQILKNLSKLIPNLTTEYFVQYQKQSSSNVIEIRLCFGNCGLRALSALIDIKIDLSKKSFQTSLSVLEGQKLYKIQTSSKRVLICKLFCRSSTKNFNKMSVSLTSGTFKVLKPVNYFWQQDFNDFLINRSKDKNLAIFISKTLQEGIQISKPVLRQLIQNFEQDSNQNRRQSQEAIKRSIYRYIMKSSIEPSFEVSFGSGKYEMMECLTKEEIFYTNSMAQNIVTDFNEFNSHNLYLTPKVPLKSLRKLYAREYFSSNDEQLTVLKTKIEPPGTRVNLGLESKYVYNMIELNESSKINLRKFNGGGFSQISIAEVQFWYMLTASNKKMAKLDELRKERQEVVVQNKVKKQHKKILVFKSNKYNSTESVRNRITHQMKIVAKFKGTPSIFIPQYFNIVNPRSSYGQYLIMEHLPSPTLNEYVEIHKNSISFLTKIHLASLIVHALQILKNNEIVHMDIKPSNIIVGKRMIIKLFDFGESYNKEVCEKNYKPAFSNPYGSPEIVDREGKMEFTEKSDIYSWGVLIWQLIFKRYPFYFPIQKTAIVLKNKDYDNYTFYVPQEEGQYGSWEIMPLVRSVLLKAMDKDLKSRPFTIWLMVVLKECLTHLINLEYNSSDE